MRPNPVGVLILLFAWSVFAATSGYSQSVKFSLSAGIQYGPYAMGDLREFRDNFVRFSPFESFLKPTYDFPARPGFEFAALLQTGRWHAGVTAWRISTGARSDYEDYSGFYRFDIIAAMNAVGLRVNYDLLKISGHRVFGSLQAATGLNKVKFIESFDIGTSTGESSFKFSSQNWIAMPGVGYRHALNTHLSASLEGRYHFDIALGALKSETSDQPVRNLDRDEVSVQWNGFRATLNVSYVF